MRIHVYSVCWNEARMAGFFVRHYGAFAERIVVYDDDSSDETTSILGAAPNVTLRRFVRTDRESFERSKRARYEQCWKESRGAADWVIIVDMDEHVFHPRLVSLLADYRRAGVTFVPTLGFEMTTDDFPGEAETLCRTRTRGVPDHWYSKPILFDPGAVDELNLMEGGHTARPQGRIVLPADDEVMLLHYKYLGLDYVIARYHVLSGRRTAGDWEQGLSFHHAWPAEEIGRRYAAMRANAVDISVPNFRPRAVHPVSSWRTADPA